MTTVPWTYDARPDTRVSNVRIGIWLFLASEAMFFGSLFSGYVLLRAGSSSWPDGSAVFSLPMAGVNTVLLLAAAILIAQRRALLSSVPAVVFLILKLIDYRGKVSAGLLPSTNLMLACWFVLTAVHALHVAGGVIANVWLMRGEKAATGHGERLYAVRLYWYFVDLVWLAILVSFYLL
jgi:heme/copper-type cytochrome/quinol oxidase subunit 3